MYLSRLTLAEGAIGQPELWRTFSSPYAVHQAIWRLFPRAAGEERDFLYRLDTVGGRPQVFTLAAREPQPSSLWRQETKKVAPDLRSGDRLEVSVRVNPVVMRERLRHDVVMDLKKRLGWKELPPAEREREAELVQRAMSEWLAARAERCGIAVHGVRAEGYRSERFAKPGAAAKKPVVIGLCDLELQVEVSDPARLLETWKQGLGPAKGFGCGLMLLKRTRR